MIPKNILTGILLSGGKSSRMGREKGDIQIGNSLLYKYPLRTLENTCGQILISTCKGELFDETHEQVCDEIPGIGPIGGIYSALKTSSNEINIILSYDMPLVNKNLFAELLKYSKEADIILPALSPGKPEPLCGIYHRRILPEITGSIKNGKYAVHGLLKTCSSKIILIDPSMPCYHENLFLNINSQADVNKLHGML